MMADDDAATNMPCTSPLYVTIPCTNDKCAFRLIPTEILQLIVSFGDVASRVLLAATCKSFRRFVFNECPFAWQEISFPSPQAAKLTDPELFALLTHVKAAQVTTSLSIFGCTSIRGRGLSALFYSRCLEQIELRKSHEEIQTLGPTGLDNTFVLGVLSSMAPINTTELPRSRNGGLKIVKIRKQFDQVNHYQCFNNQICNFLENLTDAMQREIRERRIVCRDCEEALVDVIEEEDFSWRASTCYCSHCKIYICHLCEFVDRCVTCLEQCCGDCFDVSVCSQCEKCFCSECRDVGHCDSCQELYCEECRPIYSCTSNDENCSEDTARTVPNSAAAAKRYSAADAIRLNLAPTVMKSSAPIVLDKHVTAARENSARNADRGGAAVRVSSSFAMSGSADSIVSTARNAAFSPVENVIL